MWGPLQYVQGISKLTSTFLQTYHRPQVNGISLESTFTREGPPFNVVLSTLCYECPSTYVGQIGRRFATRMKEYQSSVLQSLSRVLEA